MSNGAPNDRFQRHPAVRYRLLFPGIRGPAQVIKPQVNRIS
jgi:hypothetical protein